MLSTDEKPSSCGAGRSPIDWVFERADFESFHTAALVRKRASVRFRLEQESLASTAGHRGGARLQNRLERGARALERQISHMSVKEKLDGISSLQPLRATLPLLLFGVHEFAPFLMLLLLPLSSVVLIPVIYV